MLERALTTDDFHETLRYTHVQRTQGTPFDVVTGGRTSGTDKVQDGTQVALFAEAGATWWLESFYPQHTFEQIRQRIHQGLPQL